MTATIINLAAYRPALSPIAAKAPRRRSMQLSDAQARVLQRLNCGEAITDIGQIDKATKQMLVRLTKKGWLVEGRDYTFPAVKRCWIAAPMLEEVLPSCYKF